MDGSEDFALKGAFIAVLGEFLGELERGLQMPHYLDLNVGNYVSFCGVGKIAVVVYSCDCCLNSSNTVCIITDLFTVIKVGAILNFAIGPYGFYLRV